MNHQINLLYGHPHIYQPLNLKSSSPINKWAISFLAALLVAETAVLSYTLWVNGTFSSVPNPIQAVQQLSFKNPFGNLNLTLPNWNQKGDILGASTNVPFTSPSPSLSPSEEPNPSSSVSPTATVTPGPVVSTYTVKSGDNWWQIIRKVCGTKNVNKELVDFSLTKNEPTLHTGDIVQVYCTIP